MPKPWEKYEKTQKPWEKYSERPLAETPALESAVMGGADALSLGFADEIAGGAKALYKTATGPDKLSDIADTYRRERDLARASMAKAEKDNPNAYLGGQIAGGVGSAFIPGLGVAKGAGLLGSAGRTALTGGVMGLGTSEADLTKAEFDQALEDAATGATVGAVTDVALRGAGKAVKSLTPTNVAKKAASVMLGAPEAATERYIKNPSAIKEAKPLSGVADSFSEAVSKLKDDVIFGSQKSRSTLAAEGTSFSGKEVAAPFQKKIEQILSRSEGVVDPQDRALLKYLEEMRDAYASADKLSANRVKDAIQKLDAITDWDMGSGQIAKLDQVAKKDVRKGLDDLIKTASPGYREQMKETASNAALLDKFSDKVSDKDKLTNYLTSLGRGRKDFALEELKAFDEARGTKFAEDIKDSLTKQAFDKQVTQGSRNVHLYKTFGEAGEKTLGEAGESTKLPFAKQAGALVGAYVDRYGPRLTMSAVDTAAAIERFYLNNPNMDAVRRAASGVIEAAKKGNPSAILTFQLLSKTNPQYIELLKEKNETK